MVGRFYFFPFCIPGGSPYPCYPFLPAPSSVLFGSTLSHRALLRGRGKGRHGFKSWLSPYPLALRPQAGHHPSV